MAILKHKTEGGSGGKRGHSNMDHWVTTEEIKNATRKRRRLESKRQASDHADELATEPTPLKILLPITAEETLKQMFEEAGLDSVAWKRVKTSWYVRLDPKLGQAAYDRFLSVLDSRSVRFEEISEQLFWSSNSVGW